MPIRQRNRLFQPTFAFPMISVGVLAVAFLVYYFPVTAQQEASLNRRAFRSLAAVSDSIQIRVGALTRAFGQAVKAVEGKTDESVDAYLKVQAPDFELRPSRSTDACVPEEVTFGPRLQDARHYLEFRCGGWRARVALEGIVGTYLRGTPEQIFDDVVLLDDQGSVLYQSIRTGSRISRLPQPKPAAGTGGALDGGNPPSDTAARPPAFAESSQSSSLVAVDIAGEPFKLYLVPIALELAAGDATEGASGRNLILGGLMRVSRFRADSMAVPGTALVSVILLVLIVIAATWPLLKFTSMRATERIPRRSALYFFASTLATIILVCVLAIHLQYIFDLGTTDDKLKTLGGAIEQHFDDEVRQALAVMDSATNSGKFASTLSGYGGQTPCESVILSSRTRTVFSESNLLTQPKLRLMEYPYFDRVFWSDNFGHQHIKWDASALPTQPTFVGDRPYFVETAGGNLWQFADRPAGARFRVDSLFSRNTGEYTAVISQKVSDTKLCKDGALSVISMVTPLLSLIDPVLPPDYGFAVVDDRGAVLFHSTASKNGRENFLDEVEDAGELRAALFAGQGSVLTARYLGFSHRLSVTRLLSIQPSPWSLVVFHNLSEGAAEGVVRSVLFSLLALLYFAVIVLGLVVMFVPSSGRPPTWIWPRGKSRGAYLQLTLTITGFALLSYLLVFETTSLATTLATAFAVPVFAMAVSALKLRPKGRTVRVGRVVMDRALMIAAVAPAVTGVLLVIGPRTGSPLQQLLICEAFAVLVLLLSLPSELVSTYFARVYVPSLASSVAVLWASMLILAGMLPCVAFFKVSYHYHDNLSVKRQQLQTVSALAERETRVRAHYARVGLTPSPNDARADVTKWLFLRRRLDSSLDRYDEVFLGASGQVYSPDTNRVTPRGDTSTGEAVLRRRPAGHAGPAVVARPVLEGHDRAHAGRTAS